jgi:16S rRNA (guanine966-N2)-methyltransferase
MQRVRQAIFDMLADLAPDSGRVLDLYAGTGALGIESLSRGAAWVDFVERDRGSCEELKSNLARLGLRERSRVHCLDAARALGRLPGRYDIVFLDPPYADAGAPKVLERLVTSNLVEDGSLVVLERSKHSPHQHIPSALKAIKEKQYGDTLVSIYTVGPAAAAPEGSDGGKPEKRD